MESFIRKQEQRVRDYIQAYIATGRPPPPCPQVPTDPKQRAALGLPPLFESYTEVEGGVNGVATTSGTSAAAPDLAAQAFHPVKTQEYGSDTIFHSIVAQPEYSRYSFEVCSMTTFVRLAHRHLRTTLLNITGTTRRSVPAGQKVCRRAHCTSRATGATT